MPIPLILDVDTGVDDALALMLAARHPEADLRAVTCVGGNAPVEQVVANTLQVLDAAGAGDIPVARGAARPLLAPAHSAAHVHGSDGLGGCARPSDRRPAALGAVELLRGTLQRAVADGERITLVPTAPLTNIALLLRTHPASAAGIERIVFMGGSAGRGNATASAEFNIWHDPEAAAIVLAACGELAIPVTMYGLDVFESVLVGRAEVARLRETLDPAALLAAELLDHQIGVFAESADGGHGMARIGDAGAVCAALDPDGIRTEALPVSVDTSAGPGRGRTIVDLRTWSGDVQADAFQPPATTVDVALQVDAARYVSMWLSIFD